MSTTTTTNGNGNGNGTQVGLAANAFGFRSGAGGRMVLVSLEVSDTGQNGPWGPALPPERPVLTTGNDFFVRITVENKEGSSELRSIDVSGFDVSTGTVGDQVLTGVCVFSPPLLFEEQGTCVVGPSDAPVASGDVDVLVLLDGQGKRQGSEDGLIIRPPIARTHEFTGREFALGFYFAAFDPPPNSGKAAREPTRVEGTTNAPQVDFATADPPYPLSAGVVVNCDDLFRGGGSTFTGITDGPPGFSPSAPTADDPELIAFSITVFDLNTGAEVEHCEHVPMHDVEFGPEQEIIMQFRGQP